MSEVQVQATANLEDGTKREVAVNYDFGNTAEEMIEKFGADTVFANAKAQMTINLQAAMRRWATPKEGEPTLSDEEIQAKAAEWQPGNKQVVRKTKAEKVTELLSAMTAEEKMALFAKIRGDQPQA